MENIANFLASEAARPYLIVIALVDLVLRGITLWRSAKASQKYWFIALLVVNSLGLLPLAYLIINRQKPAAVSTQKKAKK